MIHETYMSGANLKSAPYYRNGKSTRDSKDIRRKNAKI